MSRKLKLFFCFCFLHFHKFSLAVSPVPENWDESRPAAPPKFLGDLEEAVNFTFHDENRTLTWTILEGNPRAVVKLLKDGNNITNQLFEQILNEYENGTGNNITIRLKRITLDMEGSYRCVAENTIGVANKTIRVFVKGGKLFVKSSPFLIISGSLFILTVLLCLIRTKCNSGRCCLLLCCDGQRAKCEDDTDDRMTCCCMSALLIACVPFCFLTGNKIKEGQHEQTEKEADTAESVSVEIPEGSPQHSFSQGSAIWEGATTCEVSAESVVFPEPPVD